MTVNPGFGGQSYIASMEAKIRAVRAMISHAGLDDAVDLEVDGGISPKTIAGAAEAGANVLVAGSALFNDKAGLGHAVSELRSLATSAFRG
jgi:ribulose-phosphate 3-epimerase